MVTQISLTQKKCLPCEGIGRVMNAVEINEHLNVVSGWSLSNDGKHIERTYVLKNFAKAVERINQIKGIAEDEGHHPDLHLTGYKNLKIVLYTHALDGLTENDFIMASKINLLG